MKNKVKTHKATKKRFKITKNKKVLHGKQGNNDHLRIKKSGPRKRRLKGKTGLQNKTERKKIIALIN